MLSSPASFDSQADNYDQRVGLPEKTCREVVRVVLSLTAFQPGDLIVEVGAGTGLIGQWFVQSPCQYFGFDLSANMLEVFRTRLDSHQSNWTLLPADGNQKWAIADATARVVFSSRAIHLLEIEQVVNEFFRVALPDQSWLLLGRIQRQRESIITKMRQQMQHLLRQRGFSGRQGDQNQQQITKLCCQRGAKKIAPIIVSQWKVLNSLEQSLKNWEQKPGLAGIDIPNQIKQEILEELRIWTEETFGQLNLQIESEESYVLQGVYLSAIDK